MKTPRRLRPDDADRLRDEPFTYSPVGATATAAHPPGFHFLNEHSVIGHGREDFERAGEALMTWRMHTGAGLDVAASSARVGEGEVVRCRLGPLKVPCRVVWVVEEPDATGFGYGTLPGHPESGEEAFVVRLDGDVVTLTVAAYSRPGTLLARLGGSAGRAMQRRVVRRYAAALRSSG